MEKLLEAGGLAGSLTAITVMTALHLLTKVFEFLWRMREKKDSITEKTMRSLSEAVENNTAATSALDGRLKTLETTMAGAAKFRVDMRRLYAAVKIISGSNWEAIKKRIIDEERPLD